MTDELAGKVAIVTGGASGIGRGIAERFAAEGAGVVIADVRDDLGAELVDKLNSAGHRTTYRHTDVGDQTQVGELVASAVSAFGGLHVMVNNAGISSPLRKGLFAEDFEEFDRVMRVNLLGVMAGTREAARHMADNGGGSIINLGSIGGIQAGGVCPPIGHPRRPSSTSASARRSNWRTTRCGSTAWPGQHPTRSWPRRPPTRTVNAWSGSRPAFVSRCATIGR